MTSPLRSEDGYVIAIAMVIMAMMLTIALSAIAFVDTESESSRRERAHESRLNLTEGVLAAQIFQLSRGWPRTAPTNGGVCTEAATDGVCPSPAQVKAQFSGVDILQLDPKWDVRVRDNKVSSGTVTTCNNPAPPQYYSDAEILQQPAYDANGDCQLWVRAEGTLEGKRRVVVAQVRVENRPLAFPAAPFVAGSFNTGNNAGSKVIVDTGGYDGLVRCNGDPTVHKDSCIDYADGQVQPVNRVRSEPSAGSVLDPIVLDQLRAAAVAANTYYPTGCPAVPDGAIVFVESGQCSYSGNQAVNGNTKQGIFIVNKGTLSISGGMQWWGVIYALNGQNCGTTGVGPCLTSSSYKDVVVDVSGTPTIHGGIFVDGTGRLTLGASGSAGTCQDCLPNLIYDDSVTKDLTVHGTAGIIQNTWRELMAG